MTQRNPGTRSTKRILIIAGASTAVLLLAAGLYPQRSALAASTSEPAGSAAATAAAEAPLLNALDGELKRAMSSLGPEGAAGEQQPKPYFLSYAVSDATQVAIAAQFGAIANSNEGHRRTVDVQVRLGSPAEDNTHGDHRNSALTTFPLPLTDDPTAIARSLWYATNRGYARALDGYLKVKTEQQVRAKEEDSSADFSKEKAETDLLAPAPALVVNRAAWEQRLREISNIFTQYPDVFSDQVEFQASNETDYFVSSEGVRVATPSHVARLVIVARTRAADGMDMFRDETFEADSAAGLPDQKTLTEKVKAMGKDLEALRVRTHYRAIQRPGHPQRACLRGLLPRGARPPSGRPAPARRRRGPDLYQAARQADPAHLPQRLRRPHSREFPRHLSERPLRLRRRGPGRTPGRPD